MTVKKFFITVSALLLAASLMASCSAKQNKDDKDGTNPSVTTERKGFEDVTVPPEQATSAETTAAAEDSDSAGFTTTDAVAAARAWMGNADKETGFLYSYSFDEMITEDGKEYYKIRVSWYLEEEDRYSLCCYLLVGEDGSVRNYNW